MLLCLISREGNKAKEVQFVTSVDVFADSLQDPFRISPIFPVDSTLSTNPATFTSYTILFAFLKAPFSAIGKLIAKLNDERVGDLWFTHGLASLLVISEVGQVVDNVISLVDNELYAHEIWTVKNGTVQSIDTFPPVYTSLPINVVSISSLPPDIRAVFDEYYASIHIAVNRSAAYLPYHLRILTELHNEVLSIIHLLAYIYSNIEPPLEVANKHDISLLAGDPERKLQSAKSLIDQILQINGALSYVITQGYTGIVPILEHACPIQAFSLLGVGSAFNALNKVYETVCQVFSKYPIPRVIHESYNTEATPFPVFRNFADYNVDSWRKFSNYLDNKLKVVTGNEDDKMFHLSFFSGTRGFRETLYTISAAIQCIGTCSLPRWTLVTLTHEYLHAHIRAILAVIHRAPTKAEFAEIYKDYLYVETANEASISITLRKRLFFSILATCETAYLSKQGAKEIRDGKEEGETKSKRFSANKAYALFKDLNREVNEYLVHTLDFIYFYDCNIKLYIKLVWLTWATLPEIQERLSHYLLRTLLATSINLRGDSDDRFESSLKKLKEIFQEILDEKIYDDDHVIQSASELLNDSKEISALRFEFNGAVRFVDLANNFLNSVSLHSELKLDDLQVSDVNNNLVYPISACEFQDINITSPIAFIADQAQKKLTSKASRNYENILRDSCWELLVIASARLTSE